MICLLTHAIHKIQHYTMHLQISCDEDHKMQKKQACGHPCGKHAYD